MCSEVIQASLQVQLMDSGDGGCPGLAVLRAVEEAPSLAPESATPLPLLEVESIAGGDLGVLGPATTSNVS